VVTFDVLVKLVDRDALNLQVLEVSMGLIPSQLKLLLKNQPERIRDAHLNISQDSGNRDQTTTTITVSDLRAHHDLEKLDIIDSFYGSEECMLLPFLDTCSRKL